MSHPICIPRLVRKEREGEEEGEEDDKREKEEEDEYESPQPYGTCSVCQDAFLRSMLYKNGDICDDCVDKMYHTNQKKSKESKEYERYIESIFPEPNGNCHKCNLIFPNKDLYKNGGFCEKCIFIR